MMGAASCIYRAGMRHQCHDWRGIDMTQIHVEKRLHNPLQQGCNLRQILEFLEGMFQHLFRRRDRPSRTKFLCVLI